jgi:hypothetical protein
MQQAKNHGFHSEPAGSVPPQAQEKGLRGKLQRFGLYRARHTVDVPEEGPVGYFKRVGARQEGAPLQGALQGIQKEDKGRPRFRALGLVGDRILLIIDNSININNFTLQQ